MTDTKTVLQSMEHNATENGYYLCPDTSLLESLISGLATNETRYGYGSCPCRTGCGIKQYDSDIICPCEYRDADVHEYGMCYCGLFVNAALKNNPSQMGPIPERRPVEIQEAALAARKSHQQGGKSKDAQPVSKAAKSVQIWRCSVCGYLCARELPPPICPICKAPAERFRPFSIQPG